jgi:hypothetical protein
VFRASGILIALLLLDSQAGSAAYYSVTGGGVQFQIGNERPMPVQPPTTGGAAMNQVGTGTLFPPLLIPPNPDAAKALIQQTAGPDPKKMTIPPGVFVRPVPGAKAIGVRRNNPKLFQFRTNVSFSAPAPALGAAVLRAGGRTGPSLATFQSLANRAYYEKTAAQFGGPMQTRIVAATRIIEWGDVTAPKLPCKHPAFGGLDTKCRARLIALYPGTLAPLGAKVGFTAMTLGTPAPMSPNIVYVSIPNTTGLVAKSASGVSTAFLLEDRATIAGFPWTTGRVIVSAMDALGRGEKYTVTGMDSRVNGVGTISLVSGALANRRFSGETADHGWLRITVPEPSVALGECAALATIAACHVVARRRAGAAD